jgi:hypothetical protein
MAGVKLVKKSILCLFSRSIIRSLLYLFIFNLFLVCFFVSWLNSKQIVTLRFLNPTFQTLNPRHIIESQISGAALLTHLGKVKQSFQPQNFKENNRLHYKRKKSNMNLKNHMEICSLVSPFLSRFPIAIYQNKKFIKYQNINNSYSCGEIICY